MPMAEGSPDRRASTLAPGSPSVDALLEQIYSFGPSELGALCALAAAAGGAHDGTRVRIAGRGSREERPGPARSARGREETETCRMPIRGPVPGARTEAWLVAEAGDGAELDALAPIASLAGLILERHRLLREVRRARRERESTRSSLAHQLRGDLHVALMRIDSLALHLRGGEIDLEEMQGDVERLRDNLEDMVGEIRELMEAPARDDVAAVSSEPEVEVRIPELMRDLVRGADAPNPLEVEVEAEVPPLRADRDWMGAALSELVDVAGRSGAAPTLGIRSDDSAPGVHLVLGLSAPEATASDGWPGTPEDVAAQAPGFEHRVRAGGDRDEGEVSRPTLWELVEEMEGDLWITAGGEDRLEAHVLLPARKGEDADGGSGGA